uniref:Peptidase S1 domain-containing protein n=1 Tax=Salvator merianae TaxID=96440 RepID=A0A8D0C1A1_SALMN
MGLKLVRKLDTVIVHQDFNGAALDNDLALILLDAPLEFSEKITPPCLPLLQDLGTWQNCWVTAWRSTAAGTGCSGGSSPSLPPLGVSYVLISFIFNCAEFHTYSAYNTFCSPVAPPFPHPQVDSGDPLVCTDGNDVKWFTIGIASKRESCEDGGAPVIYTGVFSYLGWIQQATAGEGKPFIPHGVDDVEVPLAASVPDSAPDSLPFPKAYVFDIPIPASVAINDAHYTGIPDLLNSLLYKNVVAHTFP